MCDHLGLNIQQAIADREYGRGRSYKALRDRNIRAYIPLHDERMGQGKLTPKSFRHDRPDDQYIFLQVISLPRMKN